MESDKIIRLLTVMESSNDVENIVSMMRNSGFAIRSSNSEDQEEFFEALEQQTWDLIICALSIPNFSALQALELVRQSGKDIPFIIIAESYDQHAALETMQAGARNFLVASDQEMLLLIIARELANLDERRAYRHTRNMLTESEKRSRTLMDSSRDAIAYIHEGMHIYSNSTYLEIFGYVDADDIEGIPIMDLITVEDHPRFKEILRGLSKGDNPKDTIEFCAVKDDGETFNVAMEFSPAGIDGEPCTQLVIRTTAHNKELENEIDALRKQDLLTGLFNRQYLLEHLERAVITATNDEAGKNSALIHLDIDDFNLTSESVGIATSDLILNDVATMLRKHAGPDEIIAHLGDGTFTILTSEVNINKVLATAKTIQQAIADHIFNPEGRSITCTCSIGITPITQISGNTKKVLANVDQACKRARASGGNSVHLHTDADERASNEQDLEWVQKINNSLENDRFRLVYQPIVSLHAEPGERYEILLRMLDSDNQEIMPADFLDVAERTGLMPKIDRWVIKQAIKVLATKRGLKVPTQFFIKLSYDSIKNQTILIWVSKLLKAARLHGACLIFEISEAYALGALKETKLFVNGLKQLHCQFAIDHVGRETNSFTYLKHLDATYLKIDGSFIAELSQSTQNQKTVKSICEMARIQEKLLIAEHVQDANTLALLWQYGINFIQGYYLQQPDTTMDYDFSAE